MTRVWWCQEHESNGQPETSICYRWALFLASGKELAGDCRMVPMRLIPDNDVLVFHKLDGAWPEGLKPWHSFLDGMFAAQQFLEQMQLDDQMKLDGQTP